MTHRETFRTEVTLCGLSATVRRILEQAEKSPDTIAVHHRAGTVTYRQLTEQALDLLEAMRLHTLVQPGQPVAVLADRDITTLTGILACLFGGHPPLVLSRTLPSGIRDVVAQDAGVAAWLDGTEVIQEKAGASVRVLTDTFMILTTSGSTGTPKGVRLTPSGVDRFVDWAAGEFGLGANRTTLSLAPFSFDISLLDIWATLSFGGTVVVPTQLESLRGSSVLNQVRKHGAHVIQAVPLFYTGMSEVSEPCVSVEHVIITGDTVDAATLHTVRRLFPRARIVNIYGSTESNDTFMHVVDPSDVVPLPIGQPLPGVEVLVLDEAGGIVDGESAGELWVRSPFGAAGYTDPSRDVDRFLPDPRTGTGPREWFRTGDLVVRTQEGTFRLSGRTDRQAKVRGIAVNLDEIEKTVTEHPEIVEAAAQVQQGDRGGQHVVVVARAAPSPPLISTLREHCALRLPAAAVPDQFTFTTHALARTGTGKLDRRAIFADRHEPHITHEVLPQENLP